MTLRKRRILSKSIILIFQICLTAIIFGCSEQNKSYDNSKIISLSENTNISISVSEKSEDQKIFFEAEQCLKKYLNDFEYEYIKPDGVVFGDITPQYIYGCECDSIVYIDNCRTEKEMRATIVHELLHLQNPVGLDSQTEFGIVGHNLTEALVEKMTQEITKQPDTKRTQLLDKWISKYAYQIMCQAFFNHNPKLFDDFLNDEQLHKVVYQGEEYFVSTSIYFRISFDKWMIIEDEFLFEKLKMEKEP